jgi:hypothetical protein
MNGGIFYAEERRRLLWIWDEDKGGVWVLQILWVGWV